MFPEGQKKCFPIVSHVHYCMLSGCSLSWWRLGMAGSFEKLWSFHLNFELSKVYIFGILGSSEYLGIKIWSLSNLEFSCEGRAWRSSCSFPELQRRPWFPSGMLPLWCFRFEPRKHRSAHSTACTETHASPRADRTRFTGCRLREHEQILRAHSCRLMRCGKKIQNAAG